MENIETTGTTTQETIDLSQLSTPIQAAARVGTAPQYLYQMLRNGKIPAEHLVALPKGDGTMREVMKPSFYTWFASRATGKIGTAVVHTKAAPVVTRQATVDELIDAMAIKLEASGNKKFAGLAEALKSLAAPAAEVHAEMEGAAANA